MSYVMGRKKRDLVADAAAEVGAMLKAAEAVTQAIDLGEQHRLAVQIGEEHRQAAEIANGLVGEAAEGLRETVELHGRITEATRQMGEVARRIAIPIVRENRETSVTIRLSAAEHTMATELAADDGISVSDVMRMSLRRAHEAKFGPMRTNWPKSKLEQLREFEASSAKPKGR
jgi:hypothetical protein